MQVISLEYLYVNGFEATARVTTDDGKVFEIIADGGKRAVTHGFVIADGLPLVDIPGLGPVPAPASNDPVLRKVTMDFISLLRDGTFYESSSIPVPPPPSERELEAQRKFLFKRFTTW